MKTAAASKQHGAETMNYRTPRPTSGRRRARCDPRGAAHGACADAAGREGGDPVLQLIAETRGLFDKLAGDAHSSTSKRHAVFLPGSSWQVVLWQPKWLYAERDGLCYQRVTASEGAVGHEPRRIAFEDVTSIDEFEMGEFTLQCRTRTYVFRSKCVKTAHAMASRLRVLCEHWLLGSECSLIKNLDTGVAVPLVSFVGVRSPVDLLDRTTPGPSSRSRPGLAASIPETSSRTADDRSLTDETVAQSSSSSSRRSSSSTSSDAECEVAADI